MIGAWIGIIVTIIIAICIVAFCVYGEKEEGGIAWIMGIIATIIVAIAICGGILFWLYGTESGARAIKDTKSNASGGIERTVTVYDFDGDIIQQYSGKFDVEYNSERIKFDDENGKRHIIYYTTGTVIIDEK